MATLKIWNIEDEIVLEDEGPWDALDDVLLSYMDEHSLFASGGSEYKIKVHTDDTILAVSDEFEHEDGLIAGRYELKV